MDPNGSGLLAQQLYGYSKGGSRFYSAWSWKVRFFQVGQSQSGDAVLEPGAQKSRRIKGLNTSRTFHGGTRSGVLVPVGSLALLLNFLVEMGLRSIESPVSSMLCRSVSIIFCFSSSSAISWRQKKSVWSSEVAEAYKASNHVSTKRKLSSYFWHCYTLATQLSLQWHNFLMTFS